MINRAKPTDLHQHEAVRFGQMYTYESPHPIDETLQAGYFTNCKDRLRPGDEIRLVYCATKDRVRERQDVLVAAKGSAGVEVYPITKRFVIPDAVTEAPAPTTSRPPIAYEVKRGYQCFQVVIAGTGKVVSEHGTKAEAEGVIASMGREPVAA